MYRPRNGERIIEQVPSYEQWQAKLEENTKLKFENDWYSELLDEAEKDVAQLKVLLKECKALLSCLQIDDYDGNGLLLLNKINQVLGEDR